MEGDIDEGLRFHETKVKLGLRILKTNVWRLTRRYRLRVGSAFGFAFGSGGLMDKDQCFRGRLRVGLFDDPADPRRSAACGEGGRG